LGGDVKCGAKPGPAPGARLANELDDLRFGVVSWAKRRHQQNTEVKGFGGPL